MENQFFSRNDARNSWILNFSPRVFKEMNCINEKNALLLL